VIDLPDPLLTKRIHASLKRGSVLRTQVDLAGKPQYKRLFVLNKNIADGMVYCVLSTSQVDWYKIHAADPDVHGNFLYYQCGLTPCNPTEEMVINLREVIILPIDQLVKNLRLKKLEFLPAMPDHEMDDIVKIISSSRLIPDQIKSKIV
jgi:hypothetical protein